MNLSCIIIDDEPLAIKVIKNYTEQIKELTLQATFTNAVESMHYLQENEIDLLFLDVNMPLLDGYSFLESLPNKPNVIITTAHSEYAVKGYELEILDFLIKPIPFPRFLKAVNKAVKIKTENQSTAKTTKENDHLFVKVDKKRMRKIYLNDILVIESLKDYIKIITATDKYIVHQTLSSFTESLPREQFIRIHRSYTISIAKVEAIEGNSIEIGGNRYTIGRSYLNETKEAILDLGDQI
ncbi:LytR/AlgR family response regulator transcription factor [Zunongwangia sp. HGR-M22]|uniref:LytR/AlgR family response regulator transcription factor n=1 Tax=Zunongwangia sp. HGR-M22 TaxID=3015168 RepID=UPI0022DCE515|nr:LytTR family DNA-binding domain-containing protein [Zunongwangia sp. HGR-M22]WBL25233.1 LytTR family DNA-binding domain-containing protein [Zunongwangia sp. HGR-M22]